MRKTISIVLSVLLVMAMAACGGTASSSAPASTAPASAAPASTAPAPAGDDLSGKLLGIITPNATHGFMAESIKHAESEVKEQAEKYGFEYKFITAKESAEQNNAVDTLLGMNPDCIVLWPITGSELHSAAQKIMDAGVPLIIYDRLIEGFTPTSWIMGDNVALGQNTGKYFNEFFAEDLKAGPVNLLEFKGDSSTVPMQRSEGFTETADPNFKIVQAFDTGWQRQTAMEQMESYLNTKSVEEIESIKGIFTHDDEVALGVIDAIKNYNGKAKIDIRLVSGNGGRKENMDLITDTGVPGMQFMTNLFSPHMIREAVKLGVEVLKGNTLEDNYLVPTYIIDKNNLEEYMNSDDFKIRYNI